MGVIGIKDFYNEDAGTLNDYNIETYSTVITNNDVTPPVIHLTKAVKHIY